jgi:hypothetical protein
MSRRSRVHTDHAFSAFLYLAGSVPVDVRLPGVPVQRTASGVNGTGLGLRLPATAAQVTLICVFALGL